MQFDWDDLRLVIEIAKAGSMTAAARDLKLSQPTLGRRLKDFEDRLGAKIFERFPNHLAVTPFGSEILESAKRMEAAAVDVARVAGLRQATGDTVCVSSTTSIAAFLAERLDHLAQLSGNPQAAIAISTTRATVDLARREADIALRMRAVPDGGKLRTRRLARVAFSLYRSFGEASSKAGGNNVFIGLTKDRPPPQGPWLDRYAESVGGRISHRLGEFFMRHHAIRKGYGVSLLPCFIGDSDPDLARVIDPPAELDEDVYLLLHEDVDRSGTVAGVAEGLRLLFKEHEVLLSGRMPKASQ